MTAATAQMLIAGGGIGGAAAALACARAGCAVQVFERVPALAEFGAGIQLGPNVMRVLHGWGLAPALHAVVAYPTRLQLRDAHSGAVLGQLPLGAAMQQRYGAPYVTIHRADLLAVLHQAACQEPQVQWHLNHSVTGAAQLADAVTLQLEGGAGVRGDVALGADGLYSLMREAVQPSGPPREPGHLAYRALVRQTDLPAALRSDQVTVWMGPRLHLVHYPVQAGRALNVVAIVQGRAPADAQGWDHAATAAQLQASLGAVCAPIQDLLHAASAHANWRLWVLRDRPPLSGPQALAHGRIALLGDAAHPMRPYLAQGAGMAIEDAAALAQALQLAHLPMPERLQAYAQARWQRCARVQARSVRNGEIFHAQGLLRQGRNLALRLLGQRILDVPWLYRGLG